jgi:3-oxoacyl-[acyl-carrier protein] reductase
MLNRSAGRVVDMASVTGTTAWPLLTATSLAKTALIRRIEGLAASCRGKGVTVFALHPGMVRTDLLMSYASHEAMAAFLESAPAAAFSPPELAASVVVRLASGELDRLSGCFLDATADLDVLQAKAAELADDALTLRLVHV